jgi:two-component system, cell cycle sensor histidine kinase and response regulator CckA
MSAATPLPWSESAAKNAGSGFRSIFEHAPIAAARCNPQGFILETNSAFDQMLARSHSRSNSLRLSDLVPIQDRDAAESLLRDLHTGARQKINWRSNAAPGQPTANWIAWRVPASPSEPASLLVVAESHNNEAASAEENSFQAERWEAVGRLAGGVVHDFNNLLTGVMLYCDLLLSSLPHPGLQQRDRLRSYAEEIRSAVAQAAGLVRQLLVFSRPSRSRFARSA